MMMHPLDLLRLARTSKKIRSIIMARTNRYIWTAAFAQIDTLPEPPTFLNEPQYAAFLFESLCTVKVCFSSLYLTQGLQISLIGVTPIGLPETGDET